MTLGVLLYSCEGLLHDMKGCSRRGEALSGFRILIVEDNPDTVELLEEQLDEPSYEISSASDGQEAILRVGERAPDLIIMDVMMPHLDGFETSRYLKQKFRDLFLPIIVLSAKSDSDSRSQGARYGCEDYLGKPYSASELNAAVSQLLELGRMENALLRATSEDEDALHADLVELRLAIARRQIEGKNWAVAHNHVERILELSPNHEEGLTLLRKVEARQAEKE